MKANRKHIMKDREGAQFISSLVMLLIGILVAAVLVGTVAYQSKTAAANTSVVSVPGGPALIMLWPLLFIIAPILYLVKEIFF